MPPEPPRRGDQAPNGEDGVSDSDHAPDLQHLVQEAAVDRQNAEREIALRAERIRTLSEQLRDVRKELQRTRSDLRRIDSELSRSRSDLARLRRRRSVRIAMAVATRVRRSVLAARRLRSAVVDAWSSVQIRRMVPGLAARRDDAAFRARLASALEPSERVAGPLVSALIVTRDGANHLRRLLPALDALRYRDLEVIVVDNASTDDTVDVVRRGTRRLKPRTIVNSSN